MSDSHDTMYMAIVGAFNTALMARATADANPDDDAAEDHAQEVHQEAFEVAERFGWDCAEDDDFMDYGLKATQPEILVEGLRYALDKCRPAGGAS